MPELIKMYIRNCILGFLIAGAFVGILLWFNIMNLWNLVTGSDVGILAVVVLWFAHGIVFAGVQFAYAVMSLAEKEPRGPRGNLPLRAQLEPMVVPVPVDEPQKGRSAKRD